MNEGIITMQIHHLYIQHHQARIHHKYIILIMYSLERDYLHTIGCKRLKLRTVKIHHHIYFYFHLYIRLIKFHLVRALM